MLSSAFKLKIKIISNLIPIRMSRIRSAGSRREAEWKTMICPFCGHNETKVVDSRDTNDGKAIRRRRECEKCQARFSTYEEMEIMKLTVIKRDGSRQDYDRGKIEVGLHKALEKRPVSEEKVNKIIVDI